MPRKNDQDTFGGQKKIDAEPESIAHAIMSRVKNPLPKTKDGKPIIDKGNKATERQVLKEQEDETKALEREKEKAKAPRRRPF
ncbi:MAG: hypothetical protein F4Y86_08405 [Gammaproteobacteria bacterium]|nr:hypothetical protein [Gammaproteobacteria bacterium]